MSGPSRDDTARAVLLWTLLVAVGAAVGAAVPRPLGLEAWPLAAIGAVAGHVIGGTLAAPHLFPEENDEEVIPR